MTTRLDGGGGTGGTPVPPAPLIGPKWKVNILSPYNFGNVAVGNTARITLLITSIGDANLVVTPPAALTGPYTTIIAYNGAFRTTQFSVPPTGVNAFNVTLVFTPTQSGPQPGSFSLPTNSTQGPIAGSLNGNGTQVISGVPGIQYEPVSVVFPDTQVNTSSSLFITVTATGTLPFKINSASIQGVNSPFSISILPTPAMITSMFPVRGKRRKFNNVYYPYMSSLTPQLRRFTVQGKRRPTEWFASRITHGGFPFTIQPDQSFVIQVTFTPTETGLVGDQLQVLVQGVVQPFTVALSGTGVPLIPVAINANASRAIVLSFAVFGNPPTIQQILPDDYNSPLPSSLVFNGSAWESQGMEKTLQRLHIYYENIGPATISVKGTSYRPTQDAPDNQQTITWSGVLGSTAADGTERSLIVDMPITGELIEISITRAGAAGPVCILQVLGEFEGRAEKIPFVPVTLGTPPVISTVTGVQQ